MPVSDIINHPNLQGLHEAQVLRAGTQSAADLGVVRYQGQDDAALRVLLFNGRPVEVGDVFVRPATQGTADNAEATGPFTWFGGPDSVRGAIKMRLVTAFEHSTIGENFLNPVTMPVFIDGTRATWDGPGLQDPWTAETL